MGNLKSEKEEICTQREIEFTHEDTGRSYEQDLGERAWIGREEVSRMPYERA